jgi:photosystem II stability/assembly factor-like uncharacterized protein
MRKILSFVFLFTTAVFLLSAQDFNDNPKRRFEEFKKERAYPFENIPDGARAKAFRQLDLMLHEKNSRELMLAQQPEWKNIGPFNIGGRMKAIVIHPENPDLVYAGAAAGGIWKTTDGGTSWTPIFDFENSIAFGALAMDPDNSDVIYAGTGEAVNGGNAYLGTGLYKTTDAGNTWELTGLTTVGAFSKICVHPKDHNLIYAGGIKRAGGLYRSTDGGASWMKMFSRPVTDVTINPQNTKELMIGVAGEGVFWSGDGGINWQKRISNMQSGIGRVSVQIAPSEPNIVYALVETNSLGYIYKTTNSGNYWGRIYTGNASFFNNQGFYNNYIVVHPTDSKIVLAGGIDIWRAKNGMTFSNLTDGYGSNPKAHVDQHCAAFAPSNPNIIYAGNDGGMYKTTDLGNNWLKINNDLQVTQFYSMDIDDRVENKNIGGTQDNGTQSNTNPDDWRIIVGGDGFRVAYDKFNKDVMYGASTPGGRIVPFSLNTKTGQFKYLADGLNVNDGVWDPPIEVHPTVEEIIMHGRKDFYISFSSGEYWTKFNTGLRTAGRYTAIGISPANEEVFYVGTSDGSVAVTTDFCENWENVTNNGLVNRWVKDFACSAKDAGTAYVVYSGFGTPHVFKTTDFGKHWTAISNGLPDIPVNSIALHPENENMIFIGTDLGVFASFDGGKSWLPYGTGLARSPVTDIKFNRYIAGDFYYLRAATHGRSIWEVRVTEEEISSPEINSPIGGELYTATTNQRINWYGFKEPVKVEFSIDNGSNWKNLATNVVGGSLLWKIPTVPTYNARIRVSSEVDVAQIRTSNTFTIMQIAKGAILRQGGVNYVPYGIVWDGKDGLWSTSFYGNTVAKLNVVTLMKEKEFKIEGDSLFTGIAMDRDKGILYVHKIGSTTNGGGTIYTYDTTGKLIRSFKSPAKKYPTGIEFVDGKLIVGDRDLKDEWDKKNFFIVNPETGATEGEMVNACQITYGPRCIAYDQKDYVYQVCTHFPSGGALTEAYIQKLPKANLALEVDRINLESLDGLINARGIDFDTRDKNIWVTSFQGDIYKIAGFETIVSVDEESERIVENNDYIETKIYPNPASDFLSVSFKINNESGDVRLELFDLTGRKVRTIYSNRLAGGEAAFVRIDATQLRQGVYNLLFILNGRNVLTRQVMIIK